MDVFRGRNNLGSPIESFLIYLSILQDHVLREVFHGSSIFLRGVKELDDHVHCQMRIQVPKISCASIDKSQLADYVAQILSSPELPGLRTLHAKLLLQRELPLAQVLCSLRNKLTDAKVDNAYYKLSAKQCSKLFLTIIMKNIERLSSKTGCTHELKALQDLAVVCSRYLVSLL